MSQQMYEAVLMLLGFYLGIGGVVGILAARSTRAGEGFAGWVSVMYLVACWPIVLLAVLLEE